MEIFVFSYNRGKYLRNCLDSILRFAPDRATTVVDDDSTDDETRRVLAEYDGRVTIRSARPDCHGSLGGLYGNMNWALGNAHDEYALFIQDDMQLVRNLSPQVDAHISAFFNSYPDALELQTCFMKNETAYSVGDGLVLDSTVPVYFRDGTRGRRAWFSAVGVMHVGRMRARGLKLRGSEGLNQDCVKAVGGPMGISPFPFMMWLPFAESVKFRRKSLIQRYAEWRSGTGLYPYRSMNDEEVNALVTRDIARLPIAEAWLDAPDLNARGNWMFEDAVKHYRIPNKLLRLKKRRSGESGHLSSRRARHE